MLKSDFLEYMGKASNDIMLKDVAKMSGLSITTISQYVNGKGCKNSTMELIIYYTNKLIQKKITELQNLTKSFDYEKN